MNLDKEYTGLPKYYVQCFSLSVKLYKNKQLQKYNVCLAVHRSFFLGIKPVPIVCKWKNGERVETDFLLPEKT